MRLIAAHKAAIARNEGDSYERLIRKGTKIQELVDEMNKLIDLMDEPVKTTSLHDVVKVKNFDSRLN